MNYKTLIKKFIVDNFLFGDSGNINEDTDLFTNAVVDSTGVMELVAYIEMTFNIVIEDYELVRENFSTINKISGFLQFKLLKSV